MSDMDLAAAWLALGRRDRDAVRRVLVEAKRLVRSVPVGGAQDADRDNAVQQVLLSASKRASGQPDAWESDHASNGAENVQRYLRRALRNELVRLVTKRTAELRDDISETRDHAESVAAPDAGDSAADAAELLEQLQERVVAYAGAGRRAGRADAMRKDVAEMWAMAASGADAASVLGMMSDDAGFVTARAAMYQRHSRTRRELLAYLDRLERLGGERMDASEMASMRRLLTFLKRRR